MKNNKITKITKITKKQSFSEVINDNLQLTKKRLNYSKYIKNGGNINNKNMIGSGLGEKINKFMDNTLGKK